MSNSNVAVQATNTSTSTAYAAGQLAARAHRNAAIMARKSINARSEEKKAEYAEKAIALSAKASATDLAFEQPKEQTMDAIFAAHDDRSARLFDRKQSRVLRRYRDGYENTISHSGAKSKNNGDETAQALAGLAADVVMEIAEQLLGMARGELATKYEKLNEGQKRMNSGNRIRNAVKKGKITIEQIVAEIAVNQG